MALESIQVQPIRVLRSCGDVKYDGVSHISMSTVSESGCEIVLDYGRAEGGVPVFNISSASGAAPICLRVVYSETYEGIDSETGKIIQGTSMEQQLIISRRRPILSILKCHGHVQKCIPHDTSEPDSPDHRISICSAISEISEVDIDVTWFCSELLINCLPQGSR